MTSKSFKTLLALAFAAAFSAAVRAEGTDQTSAPVNPFHKHHNYQTNPVKSSAPKTHAPPLETPPSTPTHTKKKGKRKGKGSHVIINHDDNASAPTVK